MNLRTKTLLILGISLLGAAAILLVFSYAVLISSYTGFEEESVRENAAGAVRALENAIAVVELKCGEWARWDETYRFILDRDPSYIDRNLNPESIHNLDIDLSLFLTLDRGVVFGTGFDPETRERIPLLDEVPQMITGTDYFFSHDTPVSSKSGIISARGTPLILVSEPVLQSTYEGPVAGFLVMGRYLDEREIQRISEVSSLNLSIISGSYPAGRSAGGITMERSGTDTISGFFSLPRVVGDDPFTARITTTREIYARGLQTIGTYFLFFILIGLLFIGIVLVTIDRLVLQRLSLLIALTRNRQGSGLSDGPLLQSSDELSELSRSLMPVLDDYSQSVRDLQASEERHRVLAGIVEHTRTGIISGRGTGIDVINPAYARMHGFEMSEFSGTDALSFFSPALQRDFPAFLQKAVSEGHVVFEAEHIRWDGTSFPTLNDLTVIGGDGTDDGYWILNVQDITEHRLAWKILMESESLRESHRQLKEVLSRLPDATFVIDKDGWVILWNAAMEDLTGITAESIIGRGANEYSIPFYGDKRPLLINFVIDPSLSSEQYYPDMNRTGDTLSVESYLPGTVHGPKYLSSVASPLYDAKGQIIGAIESIRDITSRKRVENALQKTNEKLNLLSSITRHDIRNRITVFFGVLPLLGSFSRDPEMQDTIQMLEKAAGAIRDQIEFTRDYQDMGVYAPEWADCGKILEKIGDEGLPSGLTLHHELNGLFLFADPLLSRVFFNLIDNAIRHGGEVSHIRVTPARSDEGLVISFEDDGSGIPEGLKEMIFERGYGHNTGLGLFLVRQILSITGISIRETGTYGVGARFEIIVPEGCYRCE